MSKIRGNQSTESQQIEVIDLCSEPTGPQQRKPSLRPPPPLKPINLVDMQPILRAALRNNSRGDPTWKKLPSAPVVVVTKVSPGEVKLKWTVPKLSRTATIANFQVLCYFVTYENPPRFSGWKHIDTVDARHTWSKTYTVIHPRQYYYVVRATDIHHRIGPFSFLKMLYIF